MPSSGRRRGSPAPRIVAADESLAIARELGDRAEIAKFAAWAAQARYENGDIDGAEPLAREALALSREIDYGFTECVALLTVGVLALLRGRPDEALVVLRESLAISLARRFAGANAWGVYFAVVDLAVHAIGAGQWRRAACLLGAADAFMAPADLVGQGPVACLDRHEPGGGAAAS